MFPQLFQLGPVPLKTYGFFVALGFISAIYVAGWLRRREGLSDKEVSTAVLWMAAAGIFSARAAYVAEHWRAEFASAPFYAALRVDQGGLMFYGGFMGAVLALALYARFRRESFMALADLFSVVLPLGHALGRVGCFFSGCCHGRVTSSWLGVCFPVNSPAWNLHGVLARGDPAMLRKLRYASLPVIPAQLIEAAANAAVFALLLLAYRRPNRVNGAVTGVYLMLYGALRFAVENLRGDERLETFLSLSIGQSISLMLIPAGAGFLAWALWQKKRAA